jgi:protein TonB
MDRPARTTRQRSDTVALAALVGSLAVHAAALLLPAAPPLPSVPVEPPRPLLVRIDPLPVSAPAAPPARRLAPTPAPPAASPASLPATPPGSTPAPIPPAAPTSAAFVPPAPAVAVVAPSTPSATPSTPAGSEGRSTAPAAPPEKPAAVAAPSRPGPAPVSAPLFDADYLHNPPPRYPPAAQRLRESGRVMLSVQVSAAGLPERVELAASSGSPRLDQAALETVRRWRFVPAQQGGKAVAAGVLVPIVFRLDD